MSCISPPELDEILLLVHLSGEADQEVSDHLQHCPYCSERAQALSNFEKRLHARLFRIDCPSSSDIWNYQLQLLPENQQSLVSKHLRRCPHCSGELEIASVYLSTFEDKLEASPVNRVRVLIAELIKPIDFSSKSGGLSSLPEPVSLRGGEQEALLYVAGDVHVAIETQEAPSDPELKTVLGLVTGMDPAEVSATLWLSDNLAAEATSNSVGNFVFSEVVSGTFELHLSDPSTEIIVPSLEI